MAAWFALTEGRYHDVADYAQAGQQHAGLTNAMIQLVLQQARGQARLGYRREVHASLDHGAKLLEQLPRPDHPENRFVFDHTKWIFYAANQLLKERYPDERLADDFHERYRDARIAPRQKTHSDT